MRKRRFYVDQKEGQIIETALRYVILKEEVTKETPLEKVEFLVAAEKIWKKLNRYEWEVDNKQPNGYN